MDQDGILKRCCNDTCIWSNEECHQITVNELTLSEKDLKFLSTIKVHTLELKDNGIGENGAKYLAQNTTIHTLYLWDNKIGDNGAKYLAQNKTIHTLDL